MPFLPTARLRAWPKARTKITEEFGQKHARVHPGYLAAADEIYDDTLRGLKDAASEFQGYTILFSGQSMGAAVATLLAARLRADRNFDIDGRMKEGMKVFPIAMARLGDQAFARGLAAMFPEMVRFTSRDDPIPALPPVGFGYDHTPVEAWMQKASNDDTDTVTFPTVICTGYANKMCNGGTNVVTGLYNWPENHVEYFGYPKL